MVDKATPRLVSGLWLALLLLSIAGGCAGISVEDVRHYNQRVLWKNSPATVDMGYYEYHPTCWRPWPCTCQCPPPYPVPGAAPGVLGDRAAHPNPVPTVAPPPGQALPPAPAPSDENSIPVPRPMPNQSAPQEPKGTAAPVPDDQQTPGPSPSDKQSRVMGVPPLAGPAAPDAAPATEDKGTITPPDLPGQHSMPTGAVSPPERITLTVTRPLPPLTESPVPGVQGRAEDSSYLQPVALLMQPDPAAGPLRAEHPEQVQNAVSEDSVSVKLSLPVDSVSVRLSPAEPASPGYAWVSE